jgi:hypothetical protein
VKPRKQLLLEPPPSAARVDEADGLEGHKMSS